MASSSKYRNYYIINEDVLKSGLKGNEMLVYALVRSYVTAGIPFDLTVAKIMERTNIGRRQTIDVLQRLVSKGKLVKVGQEKDGVKSCVYELGSAETAPLGGVKSAPVRKQHQCGNRTCRGAEVAPERCGNSTGRGAETAHVYNNVDNTLDTTFNNTDNNINSLSLSMREGEISKEKKSGGEVVFPAGSVQAKEKKEMDVKIGIIEGWQRHYKELYGFGVYGIISQLLDNPKVETVVKAGRFDILHGISYYEIGRKWPQVKMLIRHHYHPSDFGMWKDTVEMAQKLGLDTHSPKYILPEDLQVMHDRLSRKITEIEERKRAKEAEEENKSMLEAVFVSGYCAGHNDVMETIMGQQMVVDSFNEILNNKNNNN